MLAKAMDMQLSRLFILPALSLMSDTNRTGLIESGNKPWSHTSSIHSKEKSYPHKGVFQMFSKNIIMIIIINMI